MAKTWDADVRITSEWAKELIERQFPELNAARLELLGEGWDNAAYLVNESLVFRFPRRKLAAELIRRENASLPRIGTRLPLPIPVPVYLGAPEGDYPYPFAGYARIPGTTACRVDWSDEERARNAVLLAQFLAALHRIPVDEETRRAVIGDDLGRADLKKRVPMLKSKLPTVEQHLRDADVETILRAVDALADTPLYAGPGCWVHGDLYPRHLLADDSKRLCGVIDWGDVHLGDPAIDLSIAFSFLPAPARDAFREAYGPIDEATWKRARFRALHYGVLLVDYGVDVGDEAIRSAGDYALRVAPADA